MNLFLLMPWWLHAVLSLALLLFSLNLGARIGRWRKNCSGGQAPLPMESINTAILSLLALMLAFTFATAAGLFNQRKELVVDEANAIGTAYLRAQYLPAPYALNANKLLKEYVSLRTGAVKKGQIDFILKRSDEIHRSIWEQTVSLIKSNPQSVAFAIYVDSINQVIDYHGKRVDVGLNTRIPTPMWVALYLLTVIGVMSLGFHAGYEKRSYSILGVALLCSFAVVLFMIADLDNPTQGFMKTSQQPMLDLLEQITRTN